MRQNISAVLLGLLQLAAVANAVDSGRLFKRQSCNGDLCLRAIKASSAAGVNDCASFLKQTVYQCGATSTSISTVVVSAPPSTTTITSTLTSTTVRPSTFVTTIATVSQRIVTSTVTSTSVRTIFTSTTSTIDYYSYTYSYFVTSGPAEPQKRQATCSASTVSPSSVPAYASPCSGSVRYSSACSCVASASTTTISSVGSTVTSVTTSTVTPVVTQTITSTLRTTSASVVQSTKFTTVKSTSTALTTRPATTTFTSTSVVYTSTTMTQTFTYRRESHDFRLKLPDGRYIVAEQTGQLSPSTTGSSDLLLYIDSSGHAAYFYGTEKFAPALGIYNQSSGEDAVFLERYQEYAVERLRCLLQYPEKGSGAFTCTVGTDERFFLLCDGQAVYLSNVKRNDATCQYVNLMAEPRTS